MEENKEIKKEETLIEHFKNNSGIRFIMTFYGIFFTICFVFIFICVAIIYAAIKLN